MLPAFLTTIFFAMSVICGHRSARLIGGSEANLWRLAFASLFLGTLAFVWGQGISGSAFPIFLISGIIGIGFGDVALFQALPRLGPRLSLLLVQCLTAPFAAAIEWLWLGTRLTGHQLLCGAIVLAGIGISLTPGKHLKFEKDQLVPGVLFGVAAALGGAVGAVLSRKGYDVLRSDGDMINGMTAAFQRILGGLLIAAISVLLVKWRSVRDHVTRSPDAVTLPSREKWRRVLPWVLANSLAGQTIGVSCYQWAFQTTPTGIVLPIVATTPLIAIPLTRLMDHEKPTWHALVGGAIAVAGVIGLALSK